MNKKMLSIKGIVRKSPDSDNMEENIEHQIREIARYVNYKFKEDEYEVHLTFAVDEGVSGDAPLGERVELKKVFENIDCYDYCIVTKTNRFSRNFEGLEWFFKYFTTENGRKPHKGAKLVILDIGSLYKKNGSLDENMYLLFGIQCLIAHTELIDIRVKTGRGRNRVLSNPEERKKKYKGRKVGSKNKEKVKLDYSNSDTIQKILEKK
jgi:hypothetical protein